MNKICQGTLYTEEAILASITDPKATDPDGLRVSSEDDANDYPAAKAVEEKAGKGEKIVWEDMISLCRGWYDANEWDKAFCCMGATIDGDFEDG